MNWKLRLNHYLKDINNLKVYPPCQKCEENLKQTMSIYITNMRKPKIIICENCLKDLVLIFQNYKGE
jgi:uncharacterized CHY-type Zn-finger protein